MVGTSPGDGHEVDKRTGTPSLGRQTEKVGAAQHGGEKVAWRPHSSIPESEGGLQGSQRGTFLRNCSDRRRING